MRCVRAGRFRSSSGRIASPPRTEAPVVVRSFRPLIPCPPPMPTAGTEPQRTEATPGPGSLRLVGFRALGFDRGLFLETCGLGDETKQMPLDVLGPCSGVASQPGIVLGVKRARSFLEAREIAGDGPHEFAGG